MPQYQEALITPSVLKWSRERAYLNVQDAAHLIKRPIEEIHKWETGKLLPSLAQARKAAEVYKVALAVFYLDAPPATSTPVLKDFRAKHGGKFKNWSPELHSLISDYSEKQKWLSEFVSANGGKALKLGSAKDLFSKPADLAALIRGEIGFTLERQMDCRDPLKAFNLWIQAIEAYGINVCRKGGAEIGEVRGFALYDEFVPFIYVNADDSYAGRLFTLIHELVHIWINAPGISNGSLPEISTDEGRIEVFCNEVAACVLVDRGLVQRYWKERPAGRSINEVVARIAKEFSVSEEVIARTLLKHDKISQTDYESLRRYYRERWEASKDKRKGFLKYGLKMVLANGRYFTGVVLASYAAGKLSGIGASRLLNVRISNFSKLRGYLPPSGGAK